MKDEKLRLLSLKLVSDNENYMSAFRKNIDMYIREKDITLRDISESADLSFDTLKTFVYGNGSDCKLSTAIRLSKAFHVSIDELVGSDTLPDDLRHSIALYRNLSDKDRKIVLWLIDYLSELHSDTEKCVSVSISGVNHKVVSTL